MLISIAIQVGKYGIRTRRKLLSVAEWHTVPAGDPPVGEDLADEEAVLLVAL